MSISRSSPRSSYTGPPESPRKSTPVSPHTSAIANPDTPAQADDAVPPPPDEPYPADLAGSMPSVQARGRAESEPLPPPDLDSDDEPDWEALAGRGRAAGEAAVPVAVPANPESLSESVAARYGILPQASGRGADPAPPLSQSSSSARTPVVHRNPAAAAALKGLRKQGTLNAADVHKANEIERATQKKKQERKLAFEVAERNYNDAYAKASPEQQEQARTYLLSAAYRRSDKNTELGTANIARKDRGELSAPAQAIVSTAEMLNIARAAMERERPRHTPGIAMRHNLNGTLD